MALPAGRLRNRLLFGTLVPTVLALGAFGVLAHEVAQRVLEDELGRRLALAAAATAMMILPEQAIELEHGEAGSLTQANVARKLAVAKERFAVRRVAVVDRNLRGRADTAGRIAFGAEAHELGADRVEIHRAAAGRPTTSPLFLGHDGMPYKRGYAAIERGELPASPSPSPTSTSTATPAAATEASGDAVGFVLVEASADYLGPLAAFRRRLIIGGLVALALVLIATALGAGRVTRPVVRLAAAALRIGRGDLDVPIRVRTRDEVGFLAQTLDDMRAALKARDERLQMMLAGIAHEVRNPLGGLELYAGLLREALGGDAARLEEVARIEREVHHLKAVVTEFLDYARRAPVELGPVAIRPVLAEVAELARADAPAAEIAVDAPDGLAARADEGQLRRALLNLARNAVAAATRHHPSSGARVRFAARRDEDQIIVDVEDNGAGVAPELREKVFTPFFTTRERGTGLGLAFVRDIVHEHGGTVDVGAAGLGGARFTVSLKAARAGEAGPSPADVYSRGE